MYCLLLSLCLIQQSKKADEHQEHPFVVQPIFLQGRRHLVISNLADDKTKIVAQDWTVVRDDPPFAFQTSLRKQEAQLVEIDSFPKQLVLFDIKNKCRIFSGIDQDLTIPPNNASYLGINFACGFLTVAVCEYPSVSIKSGTTCELKATYLRDNYPTTIPLASQDVPRNCSAMKLKHVSSDTLTIHLNKAKYEISLPCKTPMNKSHSLYLYFLAPDVQRPTFTLFEIGDGVRRGILVHPREAAQASDPEQFELWYNELRDNRAGTWHKAMWNLIKNQDKATDYLSTILLNRNNDQKDGFQKAVYDLRSSTFTTRHEAVLFLAKHGRIFDHQLRQERLKSQDLESMRRIDQVLQTIEHAPITTEERSHATLISILEIINSAKSIELLDRLASGPSGTTLTREANQAIGRRARITKACGKEH